MGDFAPLLRGFVKLCGGGSPRRGFLHTSLCKSQRRERCSRPRDESLGTSDRVRGVLSPDLGLMGTN